MTTEKAPKKISVESAQAQIDSFLEYYGIDKADMELEDGAEAVQTMLNTLNRAIQKGVLEVTDTDDDLVVIHRFARPVKLQSGDVTEITYRDKVGKAKIAMDAVSGKKNQSRMNHFMATMGDTTESVIINLKGFDAMVYSRLATVFSMV